MLKLRLNADLRCPQHPQRKYPTNCKCAFCAGVSSVAKRYRELEDQINMGSLVGVKVRWYGREHSSGFREQEPRQNRDAAVLPRFRNREGE
jgi:hypothetical protein